MVVQHLRPVLLCQRVGKINLGMDQHWSEKEKRLKPDVQLKEIKRKFLYSSSGDKSETNQATKAFPVHETAE